MYRCIVTTLDVHYYYYYYWILNGRKPNYISYYHSYYSDNVKKHKHLMSTEVKSKCIKVSMYVRHIYVIMLINCGQMCRIETIFLNCTFLQEMSIKNVYSFQRNVKKCFGYSIYIYESYYVR